MSLRNDIKVALAARLATITTANGYSTNVMSVYSDEIPMGLELEAQEVPAILLIAADDTMIRKAQNVTFGEWQFAIQLVHEEVSDTIMHNFIADVSKAIFANSSTAQRLDEYRKINSAIYDMDIIKIEPDLNMIEANRFAIIHLVVRYTTQLFNL